MVVFVNNFKLTAFLEVGLVLTSKKNIFYNFCLSFCLGWIDFKGTVAAK